MNSERSNQSIGDLWKNKSLSLNKSQNESVDNNFPVKKVTKSCIKFTTSTVNASCTELAIQRYAALSPVVRLRLGLSPNKFGIKNSLKKRRLDKFYETGPRVSPTSKKGVKLSKYEILDSFLTEKFLLEMDKIRVDGANGLRFSARKKRCFTPGTGSPFSGAFVTAASESLLRIPKTDINPNKAVFTIDSKTSKILIVNNNACQLLGYTPRELCEMQFSSLLTNKANKNYVSALAEGQLNSEDGTMVLLSGKVVEMTTKSAGKVAVSLWIRQIDKDGRCLAVAEPVERRVAQILIDRNGTIVSGDNESLLLFQIESEDHLTGTNIQSIIPAIQLPDINDSVISKSVRKQKATGKTNDGMSFPLCLMITTQEESTNESTDSGLSTTFLYVITIWVFQNISGLIVIDDGGFIELCNHHFSMLMFGYSQAKTIRMPITRLIPNFGQEFEYLGYSRSRNVTTSSLDNEESETETDPVYYENEHSYYATPMGGMTSSDYSAARNNADISKASNDLEPSSVMSISDFSKQDSKSTADVSKAISEPVNIHPATNIDKSNCSEHQMQRQRNVGKSASENYLSGRDYENDQNVVNRRHSQHINEKSFSIDEQTNCDAAELLTPVNEIRPTSDYLLSALSETTLDTEEQSLRSADISDALREIDDSEDISVIRPNNSSLSIDHHVMNNQKPLTSTPDTRHAVPQAPPSSAVHQSQYNDGKYKGVAIHSDGNVIDILYTISSQHLPCGRKVFCVWICRDINEFGDDDGEDDVRHPNLTLTFNSVNSNVETSASAQPTKYSSVLASTSGAAGASGISSTGLGDRNMNASSRPNSVSLLSQCEEDQISGEFSKNYTTLKQIGKGAFGYVKLAFRHTDRLLVVTKFILKDKLTPHFMVTTEDKKEIPMEVYLLMTVKHPNIVTVLDVYENEKFFQLVMEKHGSGMDLFEFIDRRPMMDEQLACYIFRQIVDAIDYLHSLKILHRDIKDENIIIDQYFHVKLIDFGSATFMEDGKLFSTFYGTTEYCSPEVLAGNKYAGPELEIWALGVTLFVLVFFENPFLDIEETLRAELVMPHQVSQPLEHTLYSMLDKNPKTRYTMAELKNDAWMIQEMTSTNFNFSWIVPCENYESNPEKFFNGQIYSSATGLSTTSPHDSLSLADEDSMIGADEEIEDEEELDIGDSVVPTAHEFDYRKNRKSSRAESGCYNQKDLEKLCELSISSNVNQNLGRQLQLPITANACKNSDLNKHSMHSVCKRNHNNSNNLSTASNHNNYYHQQSDLNKMQNRYSLSHITANSMTTKTIPSNRSGEAIERSIDNVSIYSKNDGTLKKESFSCDSINQSAYGVDLSVEFNSLKSNQGRDVDGGMRVITSPMKERQNSSLLSVNSGTSVYGSSGSSCGNNSASTVTCNSSIISLSKSETNIFKNNTEECKSPIFNVVSLNDLNEAEEFYNRPMNDLSKTQCLNQISDQELCTMGKKHLSTLSSPKLSTAPITVIHNAPDDVDKMF